MIFELPAIKGRKGKNEFYKEKRSCKAKRGKKTMKTLLKVIGITYICISSVNCKSATLKQLLTSYCVPSSGSSCEGNAKATFTGTNSTQDVLITNYCQCSEEDYYYNQGDRKCELCEDGTYNRDDKAIECKNVCSTGSHWVKVENCPEGYYKNEKF